jgi:hypothetical protein
MFEINFHSSLVGIRKQVTTSWMRQMVCIKGVGWLFKLGSGFSVGEKSVQLMNEISLSNALVMVCIKKSTKP